MALVLRSKNFYLLISLISFFIISPMIVENHVFDSLLCVLLALIILICVDMVSYSRATVIFSVIFAFLAITGYLIIILVSSSQLIYLVHFSLNAVFMTIMTCMVLGAVAREKDITIDTLLGAVCGYLLIGLTWSYYYLTISSYNQNSFSYHMIEGPLRDKIQHFIYFSFETLTTLGYGDILPLTDLARSLSWLEAATGQIFLAVWISQLVGTRIAQRIKKTLE